MTSIELRDGSTYTGDLLSGIRHGFGEGSKGSYKYIGSWSHGFRDGRGEFSDSSNGNIYSGHWKTGMRDGEGTQTYSGESSRVSGCSVYSDKWCSDAVGEGSKAEFTWKRSDGFSERFTGTLSSSLGKTNGAITGVGTYTYIMPENTLMSSRTMSVNNAYSGSLVNGERDGEGLFIYSDESYVRGTWKCNQLVSGIYVSPSGTVHKLPGKDGVDTVGSLRASETSFMGCVLNNAFAHEAGIALLPSRSGRSVIDSKEALARCRVLLSNNEDVLWNLYKSARGWNLYETARGVKLSVSESTLRTASGGLRTASGESKFNMDSLVPLTSPCSLVALLESLKVQTTWMQAGVTVSSVLELCGVIVSNSSDFLSAPLEHAPSKEVSNWTASLTWNTPVLFRHFVIMTVVIAMLRAGSAGDDLASCLQSMLDSAPKATSQAVLTSVRSASSTSRLAAFTNSGKYVRELTSGLRDQVADPSVLSRRFSEVLYGNPDSGVSDNDVFTEYEYTILLQKLANEKASEEATRFKPSDGPETAQ